MPSRRQVVQGAGALAASLMGLPGASAQSPWPTRPVRIVVPFAAGGTTDILARAMAPELQRVFGQPFIIENKAGAGGNLGAADVAKSAPDGYSLLMGTVGTHAINSALYPKMPYDHVKDFAPVTLVAGVPNVLVMNPANAQKYGVNSVTDLARAARNNPGKLNMASSGNVPASPQSLRRTSNSPSRGASRNTSASSSLPATPPRSSASGPASNTPSPPPPCPNRSPCSRR